MKKIIAIFTGLLVLLALPMMALADNTTTNVSINDTDQVADDILTNITDNETSVDDNLTEEDAGITPDSALWGLERAMERVDLAFTFNKAKKAEKRLQHANERLAEVNQMVKENKLNNAEKAQKKHDKIISKVEEDLSEIENEAGENALEEVSQIQAKLQNHNALVQRFGDTKMKTKGLSQEDQAMLQNMIGSMSNVTGKLQVEVMQQKERVKIKVKATQGLTDEELEQLEMQIQNQFGEENAKIVGKPSGKEDAARGKVKVKTDDDETEVEIEFENEGNETEVEIEIEDDENETEVEFEDEETNSTTEDENESEDDSEEIDEELKE